MTLARKMTQKEQQRLYHELERMADKRVDKGREITTGATVGPVRTKEFPVDALPGQPTQVSFVVHVRLLDHPGQPVVRDVLVANQARQTVADGADESSTPVLLERDAGGTLTVIGRALHSVPQGHCRDYFDVSDVDGFDLSYIYGLRTVEFQNLPAGIQSGLTGYLTTVGAPIPNPSDKLFLDPVLEVHGPTYWPGYILPGADRRDFSTGCLVCVQTAELVPWTDPRWRWGLPPVGYASTVVSWGLTDLETDCS
jgi:hypothetical protein